MSQPEQTGSEDMRQNDSVNEAAKDYADLERVPEGGYPSAAHAAKNIRRELKKTFPGVKFSVRSKTFSMGDSVDVRWELGPPTRKVRDVIKKYQEGSFDGMQDLYVSKADRSFNNIYGGAKYVHEHRGCRDAMHAVCEQLCELWGIDKPKDGHSFWRLAEGDMIQDTARELCYNTDIPQGSTRYTVERMPDGEENPEMGISSRARWYRLACA